MRQTRKIDHIKKALDAPDTPQAGFADVHLLHSSLPEVNWSDIDTGCYFCGKKLAAPLMINAMTGGHRDVLEINRQLAQVAQKTGIAMALGSQRASLEDQKVSDTYKVVRQENPLGVVIANLDAGCTVAEAEEAIGMVQGDGIQLHVNAPQELMMQEGDRNFRGLLENISLISQEVKVPVIVKEVGFGMSRETVASIYGAGITMVDISGSGGTNFITIEQGRLNNNSQQTLGNLGNWGIPTVVSIVEAKETNLPLYLIASGGIRTAYDVAKSLTLGADLTAISRPFLQKLLEEGKTALESHVEELITGLHKIMTMCGTKNVAQLKNHSVIITRGSAQWLELRGVCLKSYACRAKAKT